MPIHAVDEVRVSLAESSSKYNDAAAAEPSYPMPWTAALVVALTCALSLVWSHYKLLWIDEIMEMQTDALPTLRQLIHVQTHFPISLDPLFYHAAAHWSFRLLGVSVSALRLPALLGFLTMQVCLGLFVRRISTERAAIFAMAFPAGTATLYFAAEGRPYGVLIGLSAVMMLAWQSVTRRYRHRAIALVALALATALALNTHYYGVLLLVPFMIAEFVHALETRRPDTAALISFAVGAAGIFFAVPFARAASEFQKHYYALGPSGSQILRDPYHVVAQTYHALLLDESYFPLREQHLLVFCVWVLAGFLALSAFRLLRGRVSGRPRHEVVLLAALATLPLFGYLLDRLVTHSMQPRYVCEAILGIAAIAGIGLDKLLPRRWNSRWAISALAALMLLPNLFIVREVAINRQRRLASPDFRVPDEVVAKVKASPTQMLYMSNVSLFDQLTAYEPDPWMRSHLALVYSEPRELRYTGHDTYTLTALHMQRFTNYRIISFDDLALQPSDQILMTETNGNLPWNWIQPSLLAEDDAVVPIYSEHSGIEFLDVRFNRPAAMTEFAPDAAGLRPSRDQ